MALPNVMKNDGAFLSPIMVIASPVVLNM
jgi:hypothetical protein